MKWEIKFKLKKLQKKNGLPIIEGSDDQLSHWKKLRVYKEIGYPILIKAAAGGGGKGMKIVESVSKLSELFSLAKTEAKSILEMMNYILKNILKIQDTSRCK